MPAPQLPFDLGVLGQYRACTCALKLFYHRWDILPRVCCYEQMDMILFAVDDLKLIRLVLLADVGYGFIQIFLDTSIRDDLATIFSAEYERVFKCEDACPAALYVHKKTPFSSFDVFIYWRLRQP